MVRLDWKSVDLATHTERMHACFHDILARFVKSHHIVLLTMFAVLLLNATVVMILPVAAILVAVKTIT